MRHIAGITTCVGETYYQYLLQSLYIWSASLDSLTIVTEPGDPATQLAGPRVKVVETDAFTRYGAHFNKGAAINYGLAAAKPTEWVLLFDADIVPPTGWRGLMAPLAIGNLYGARRNNEVPVCPLGYFQLYHARDKNCRQVPLLDCRYTHAGCYDMNFCDLWLKHNRIVLDLNLKHEGVKKINWFGPRAASHWMQRLWSSGVLASRRAPEKFEGTFSLSKENHSKLVHDIRSAKV